MSGPTRFDRYPMAFGGGGKGRTKVNSWRVECSLERGTGRKNTWEVRSAGGVSIFFSFSSSSSWSPFFHATRFSIHERVRRCFFSWFLIAPYLFRLMSLLLFFSLYIFSTSLALLRSSNFRFRSFSSFLSSQSQESHESHSGTLS